MADSQDDRICWFAARTRCGAELGVRAHLDRLGAEHFLPTERRTRTRTRTDYERPLIPGMIFVRTTKRQACAYANEGGLPVKYLIDPVTRSLLIVPDKQMEDFQRVLDLSLEEGGLLDEHLALGDRVVVSKGVLAGVEGNILELHGRTYVVVALLDSIFARVSVPRAWLERVRPSC